MLQIKSGQTQDYFVDGENFHLPSESVKEQGKSSKAIPFKGAEGCSILKHKKHELKVTHVSSPLCCNLLARNNTSKNTSADEVSRFIPGERRKGRNYAKSGKKGYSSGKRSSSLFVFSAFLTSSGISSMLLKFQIITAQSAA